MPDLTHGPAFEPCVHCGYPVRSGMVRCRGCGKFLVAAEDDFELTGHELIDSPSTKCARCGALLEPGVTECPTCMLASIEFEPRAEEPQAGHAAAVATAPTRSRAGATRLPREVREEQPTDESRGALAAAMMSPSPLAKTPASVAVDDGAFDEFVAARTTRQDEATVSSAKAQTRPDTTASEPSARKGAACIALITSLHTTSDRKLRCEIATALGALGDRQAMLPLERLMSDSDVRVRRVAAEALVRLGHPKGKSLLSAAEKKPVVPLAPAGGASKGKLAGIGKDSGGLIKLLGAAVVVLLLGGGIWMWMSSGPTKKSTKKGGKKAKVTVSETQSESPARNE